jgi:hypothetical protein
MNKTIKEFWNDYIELEDYFDRRNKLKELPFIQDLPSLIKIEKLTETEYTNLLVYLILSSFQNYADDIIEAMENNEKPL